MITVSQKIRAQTSLNIPPQMWLDICNSLRPTIENGVEAIAFVFCQRQEISADEILYIPVNWVVPDRDCYERRSRIGLVLKQDFHVFLLEEYLTKGKLDVIHLHTHPGNQQPIFSAIDDKQEAQYARFLSNNFSYQPRLISGVLNESLNKSCFRLWNQDGKTHSQVDFTTNKLEQSSIKSDRHNLELMFSRQEVFGEGVQQQLGELSVALIGCGGIGGIFVELLGRLGVKKWTLVDPDPIEEVNLNRMPGATKAMVDKGWLKVKYAKKLIKQVYPTGSYVRTIANSVESETAQKAIAKADLIVVATDNHLSRQIAQEIALKSQKPLLCLGTHIEMLPNNTPRMYCRVTFPPLDGGWCLMCANVISTQKAALESAPPQISEAMIEKGYISGVADPAVFWLNSICASKGVGLIHGMISGFVDVSNGIDWIYDFPNGNWLKTDVNYLANSNCYFCSD